MIVYWANIFLLGAMLMASWGLSRRAGIVKDGLPDDVDRMVYRRIILAQILYAAATILCVVSPYLSIGLIILLQLNYAVAPRVRPFSWL
ncbi:MAG TPA: hypothetical protein VIJ72_03520 [Rhizomicrobium sp.]